MPTKECERWTASVAAAIVTIVISVLPFLAPSDVLSAEVGGLPLVWSQDLQKIVAARDEEKNEAQIGLMEPMQNLEHLVNRLLSQGPAVEEQHSTDLRAAVAAFVNKSFAKVGKSLQMEYRVDTAGTITIDEPSCLGSCRNLSDAVNLPLPPHPTIVSVDQRAKRRSAVERAMGFLATRSQIPVYIDSCPEFEFDGGVKLRLVHVRAVHPATGNITSFTFDKVPLDSGAHILETGTSVNLAIFLYPERDLWVVFFWRKPYPPVALVVFPGAVPDAPPLAGTDMPGYAASAANRTRETSGFAAPYVVQSPGLYLNNSQARANALRPLAQTQQPGVSHDVGSPQSIPSAFHGPQRSQKYLENLRKLAAASSTTPAETELLGSYPEYSNIGFLPPGHPHIGHPFTQVVPVPRAERDLQKFQQEFPTNSYLSSCQGDLLHPPANPQPGNANIGSPTLTYTQQPDVPHRRENAQLVYRVAAPPILSLVPQHVNTRSPNNSSAVFQVDGSPNHSSIGPTGAQLSPQAQQQLLAFRRGSSDGSLKAPRGNHYPASGAPYRQGRSRQSPMGGGRGNIPSGSAGSHPYGQPSWSGIPARTSRNPYLRLQGYSSASPNERPMVTGSILGHNQWTNPPFRTLYTQHPHQPWDSSRRRSTPGKVVSRSSGSPVTQWTPGNQDQPLDLTRRKNS